VHSPARKAVSDSYIRIIAGATKNTEFITEYQCKKMIAGYSDRNTGEVIDSQLRSIKTAWIKEEQGIIKDLD